MRQEPFSGLGILGGNFEGALGGRGFQTLVGAFWDVDLIIDRGIRPSLTIPSIHVLQSHQMLPADFLVRRVLSLIRRWCSLHLNSWGQHGGGPC